MLLHPLTKPVFEDNSNLMLKYDGCIELTVQEETLGKVHPRDCETGLRRSGFTRGH